MPRNVVRLPKTIVEQHFQVAHNIAKLFDETLPADMEMLYIKEQCLESGMERCLWTARTPVS
jgi:hypothetical protein